MSRLIDTYLLKKSLGITDDVVDNFKMVSLAEVCHAIDTQPTAYDVEQVGKRIIKRALGGRPFGLITTKDAYEFVTGVRIQSEKDFEDYL